MSGIVSGRVVIVTGAGQGLGRAHAEVFARNGARVVVNDVGEAAEEVAAAIRTDGGDAVASTGSVADWDYGEELVETALRTFGGLHTLVNNAGINRDRMLVNMSEDEWDAVQDINLKGHFVPMRHAAAYWREQDKAGEQVAARIVNTSSAAGLMGSVGQGNYAAAKAGVVALTQVAAAEWGRYGITVNAIAPAARTPMTEPVFAQQMARPETGFDAMDPANVSPLVVWLGSERSAEVSGRVFEVEGGKVALADGWRYGTPVVKDTRWEASELGAVVANLIATTPAPSAVYGA